MPRRSVINTCNRYIELIGGGGQSKNIGTVNDDGDVAGPVLIESQHVQHGTVYPKGYIVGIGYGFQTIDGRLGL